jgi:phosphate uptake regulator
MKRKVQQLGSSTLAVTVPAEWARHHEIEKGDTVVIQQDENGGSLLIVPEQPTTDDAEVTIDAEQLDSEGLERAIVTQYVLGRQLVRIDANEQLTPAQYESIQNAERRLMGLGIVEQAQSEVTVRCSVAPGDFKLPTLLNRLSRTESTMRTEAVHAVLDGDADLARGVRTRYRQNNKLFYLFLRLIFATYRNPQLNTAVGLETGFPLIGYRSVAQDISLMAGVANEIASLVVDDELPTTDEETNMLLEDLLEALDEAVETTITAVTEPDYTTTEAARDGFSLVDKRVTAVNEYLKTERPKPLLELQRMVVLLERCAQHGRDSLAVATHLTFRASPDLVESK